MLNVMFWTAIALIITGGFLICGAPGRIRKGAAWSLLLAGVLVGIATAILEPLSS